MKNSLRLSAVVLSVVAASTAAADFAVYAKAGTTGAGLGVGYGITENLVVRAGYNAFAYDHEIEETDVTYDAELELRTGELLVDWHVFGGGFRLTAGGYLNRNELSGNAKGNGTYEINDVTYNAADVGDLSADVDFNSFSPYVGIGWGHVADSAGRVTLTADVGALYQGSPNVSVTANCGPALSAAMCSQLQADIDAETATLEEDITDFKWWPVISLGVAVRF